MEAVKCVITRIITTDVAHAPWHIIEATDKHCQQLCVGRILLDSIDLTLMMSDAEYESSLALWQEKLRRLTWHAKRQGRSTVLVFEGWDAAGKGGAIRRLIAGIDARLFRVISIGAPTDEEKAQHYLWRFWRHVPRAYHCIANGV